MIFSDNPIIFFDLEGTNKYASTARIVQIAIKKVMPTKTNSITDCEILVKNRLIKPEINIPQESIDIHGITNESVENEVMFKEISKSLYSFIKDCDFVGYNIIQYDLPLLRNEFARWGITFDYLNNKIIDIYLVEKFLNKNAKMSYSLSETYKRYYKKHFDNAHDAMADVNATYDIFEKQLNTIKYNWCYIDDVMEHIMPPLNLRYIKEEKSLIKENIDGIHLWNFGKYKGMPLYTNKNYCKWFLTQESFPNNYKNIVKKYI